MSIDGGRTQVDGQAQPTDALRADGTSDAGHEAIAGARQFGLTAVILGAAGVVAFVTAVISAVVFTERYGSGGDEFSDAVLFVAAGLITLPLALIVSLFAGVIAGRRALVGTRSPWGAAIVLALTAPASVAAAVVVDSSTDSPVQDRLVWAAALVVAFGGLLVYWGFLAPARTNDRNAGARARWQLALAGLLVAAVGVVAPSALARLGDNVAAADIRAESYDADTVVLGLVGEDELASRLPGWELEGYVDADTDGRPAVARLRSSDGVDVSLLFDDGQTCPSTSEGCAPLGETADGRPVSLVWFSMGCEPTQPNDIQIVSEESVGTWRASPGAECVSSDDPLLGELLTLLEVVEATPLETWLEESEPLLIDR